MFSDSAQAPPPAGLSADSFSSLLQAVGGLRNRRALVALLGSTITGVLVGGLLMALSPTLGVFAAFLAALVYLLAIGTGINAAGLLLMDQARGIASRSVVDALVFGLLSIPKFIVLALALLAVQVAIFLVIALVLFICKIPFLGPLLYVAALPLSVVVAGVALWGAFLCMVLSLPAIWQGATITRALAQTLAIVRSRLIEAVLLLLALGFLAMAVGFIIFGLLFSGLVPALGLSAGIVGFGGVGGMGAMTGMMQGYGYGGGSGGGHMVAGMIGAMLLWAVAGSLVGLVYLLGLSLVYLRLTQGLDLTAAESALRSTMAEARRRTAALGERARAATRGGDRSEETPASAEPGAAATRAAATGPGTAAASTPSATSFPPIPPMPPADHPHRTPGEAWPSTPLPPLTHTDIDLPMDEPAPSAGPSASPAVPPAPAPLPPPVAAPPAPTPTACPQCLSAVAKGDVFCGVCGYRLR